MKIPRLLILSALVAVCPLALPGLNPVASAQSSTSPGGRQPGQNAPHEERNPSDHPELFGHGSRGHRQHGRHHRSAHRRHRHHDQAEQ